MLLALPPTLRGEVPELPLVFSCLLAPRLQRLLHGGFLLVAINGLINKALNELVGRTSLLHEGSRLKNRVTVWGQPNVRLWIAARHASRRIPSVIHRTLYHNRGRTLGRFSLKRSDDA